jgi:hypothetical protein
MPIPTANVDPATGGHSDGACGAGTGEHDRCRIAKAESVNCHHRPRDSSTCGLPPPAHLRVAPDGP